MTIQAPAHRRLGLNVLLFLYINRKPVTTSALVAWLRRVYAIAYLDANLERVLQWQHTQGRVFPVEGGCWSLSAKATFEFDEIERHAGHRRTPCSGC